MHKVWFTTQDVLAGNAVIIKIDNNDYFRAIAQALDRYENSENQWEKIKSNV